MSIKAILVFQCLLVLQYQFSAALYLKRSEFEDPRLFSSAFGKRSSVESANHHNQKYYAVRMRRGDDMDDPRFLTMSFGKRSILPSLADFHRQYSIYDKRGSDLDDPRFFSGAFGRK